MRRKSVEMRKMSQTRNIRKSESCSLMEQIGHLSDRNSHYEEDIQGVKRSNSRDTSCDSEQIRPKLKNRRFIESQKYSVKKRAFSSALSINNGYSLDERFEILK